MPEGFACRPGSVIKWQGNGFTIEVETDDEYWYAYQRLEVELSADRKYVKSLDYSDEYVLKLEQAGYNLNSENYFRLHLDDQDGDIIKLKTCGSTKCVELYQNDLRGVITEFNFIAITRNLIYDEEGTIIGVDERRIESREIDYSRDPYGGQSPVFRLTFYYGS